MTPIRIREEKLDEFLNAADPKTLRNLISYLYESMAPFRRSANGNESEYDYGKACVYDEVASKIEKAIVPDGEFLCYMI
jgi:hypothetical protein